jgi:hypothetical protein
MRWPFTSISTATLSKVFGQHPYNLASRDARRLATAINAASNPKAVDRALDLADSLLGGFGVEAIRPEGEHVDNFYYNVRLLYVNQGDAYATTIVYDTKYGKFGITTWGDWVEWAEQTGEIERPED